MYKPDITALLKFKKAVLKAKQIPTILSDPLVVYAQRTILTKVIETLVNEDVKIGMMYDSLDENEWDGLNTNYHTPAESSEYENSHKHDISDFILCYKSLCQFIKSKLTNSENIEEKIEKEKKSDKSLFENDNEKNFNDSCICFQIQESNNSLKRKSDAQNVCTCGRDENSNKRFKRNKMVSSHRDAYKFISMIVSIYEPYLSSLKTHHAQFIIFLMAYYQPKITLTILQRKMEENHGLVNFYASYIFSLLVRCKLPQKYIHMCIKKLISLQNKIDPVLFVQNIFYLCCFRPELFKIIHIKTIVDNAFKSNLVYQINGGILNEFCSQFNYSVVKKEGKHSKKQDCGLLEFFAFDPPVIDDILEYFDSMYVNFDKN